MSQTEIGLIGIVIMLILLMLGTQIGFTLILVGFVGYAVVGGLRRGYQQSGYYTFQYHE